ncbi:ATP-binding cassette domain-containing protein [Neorhizobium sp. NCHU2750]|uniref:ATP-binding cassette domain-containing protein n=1 Tax=Neorhizobium sp. NCHU2750 TaxID=1825976 RepID=UPI000E75F26A|nr:hypothetical protein NCHU2750_49460 [Neorhizobium sp. NCHU2750]
MSDLATGLRSKDWRRALSLSVVAMICGVLLGGLSAWFLGSVAIAGLTAAAATFNFHVPAAFVRLFAIGRTAARYGERLFGHKAALSDQVEHRVHLFASVAAAPQTRQAGWQLGDESRLSNYLDDVEDVDFAKLRADLPLASSLIGLCGLISASLVLVPYAVLPIVASILLLVWRGKALAFGGSSDWSAGRLQRLNAGALFGAAMSSVVPLKAERRWDTTCNDVLATMQEADARAASVRRRQARYDAAVSMLGPWAGALVLATAWFAGSRGEALFPPVFLAFGWLAFGETLGAASRIIVAKFRRDAANPTLALAVTPRAAPAKDYPDLPEMRIDGLRRQSPAGRIIGASPISLALRRGKPVMLIGASGTGKTSLLKQIAGWLGDDVFRVPAGPLDASTRRELSTLVLHDAAVLSDTVRANLFAPGCEDETLWKALSAVELDDRIRQAGGLDAWIRQDQLSLGEAQRLNLARAWLSPSPIILIDEPTEHLGVEQGRRILRRLATHLEDRITVIATHDIRCLPGQVVIDLE